MGVRRRYCSARVYYEENNVKMRLRFFSSSKGKYFCFCIYDNRLDSPHPPPAPRLILLPVCGRLFFCFKRTTSAIIFRFLPASPFIFTTVSSTAAITINIIVSHLLQTLLLPPLRHLVTARGNRLSYFDFSLRQTLFYTAQGFVVKLTQTVQLKRFQRVNEFLELVLIQQTV